MGLQGAVSMGTAQRFVPVAASTATQYSKRGFPLEIWVKALPLLTANELKPLVNDRLVHTTKLVVSQWIAIASGVVPFMFGPWNCGQSVAIATADRSHETLQKVARRLRVRCGNHLYEQFDSTCDSPDFMERCSRGLGRLGNVRLDAQGVTERF